MRPFFQKPKSLVSSLASVFLRPSGKRLAFFGSPKILTIEFPSYGVRSSEVIFSSFLSHLCMRNSLYAVS